MNDVHYGYPQLITCYPFYDKMNDDFIDLDEPTCSRPSPPDIKEGIRENISSSKTVPPDTCAVCEGPASGYHYEAASCNGCKTYFRRILIAGKILRCKYHNKCCVRNGSAARVCRACRFQKCLDIGMDPMAVQIEVEALESNELLRKVLNDKGISTANLVNSSVIVKQEMIESPDVINPDMTDVLVRLLRIEDMVHHMRKRTVVPHPDDYDLDTSLSIHDRMNVRTLTTAEYKMMYGHLQLYVDFIGVIQYLESFPFYEDFDSFDKKAWVQSVCMLVHNVTIGYFAYTKKQDEVIKADGTKPEARPETPPEMHDQLFKKPVQFFYEHHLDNTEYLLLKAVVACNFAFHEISKFAQDLLTKEKEKLARYLMDYEIKYRGPSGPNRYQTIIHLAEAFIRLSASHKDIYVFKRFANPQLHSSKLLDELLWKNHQMNKDPVMMGGLCAEPSSAIQGAAEAMMIDFD